MATRWLKGGLKRRMYCVVLIPMVLGAFYAGGLFAGKDDVSDSPFYGLELDPYDEWYDFFEGFFYGFDINAISEPIWPPPITKEQALEIGKAYLGTEDPLGGILYTDVFDTQYEYYIVYQSYAYKYITGGDATLIISKENGAILGAIYGE